jgi:hypothetical protein
MKRTVLLLGLWLSLLALCPLQSWAEGPGVIQGRLVNGTAGGSSVGGLDVELRTFQGQGASGGSLEGERREVTADAQGQFRFAGLPVDQGSTYQVVATYQGVVYSSPTLQFGSGSAQLAAELAVYETTTDDGAIVVGRAHILVSLAAAGLTVTELYALVNSGDRTYIGQQETQERRWTSSYQLPTAAHNVVFEDGAWGGRFLQIGGGLVDTEPLWPGQTTVVFSYDVYCPSGPCDLSRTLQQHVSNLNVLVPDIGLAVASETLLSHGRMDAQGRSYLNFAAGDLSPETSLDLRIGLSGSAPISAPRNAAGGISALPWILLMVVVTVVFLGYPFWRQHVQDQALRDCPQLPGDDGE